MVINVLLASGRYTPAKPESSVPVPAGSRGRFQPEERVFRSVRTCPWAGIHGLVLRAGSRWDRNGCRPSPADAGHDDARHWRRRVRALGVPHAPFRLRGHGWAEPGVLPGLAWSTPWAFSGRERPWVSHGYPSLESNEDVKDPFPPCQRDLARRAHGAGASIQEPVVRRGHRVKGLGPANSMRLRSRRQGHPKRSACLGILGKRSSRSAVRRQDGHEPRVPGHAACRGLCRDVPSRVQPWPLDQGDEGSGS